MLVEFSFKNFKAFRDEQVLSLVASNDKSFPQNLIEIDNIKELNLLSSIVMYGANASGKTTVIDALLFCEKFIRKSAKYGPDKKIDVKPFMLNEKSQNEPIEFEITFIQEKVRYQYGFIITQSKVLTEWLISYPKGRARKIFYREYKEDLQKSKYFYSSYLKGEKSKLEEVTGPNSLFLSVAATFSNPQLLKVYRWFTDKLFGVYARQIDYRYFSNLYSNEKYLTKARDLIKNADLGIKDISISEKKLDLNLPEGISEKLETSFKQLVELLAEENSSEPTIPNINMMHGGGDKLLSFSFDDESGGTRQYFTLIFPILDALLNGRILLVDELDSSLHPFLVRSIVKFFHDKAINTKGAQLIFNTHDTTMLSSSLFRRDQIWFVEKDQDGSSHLYSLLEFSPRKEKSLERGYLQGRYGAIPFLSESLSEVLGIG